MTFKLAQKIDINGNISENQAQPIKHMFKIRIVVEM